MKISLVCPLHRPEKGPPGKWEKEEHKLRKEVPLGRTVFLADPGAESSKEPLWTFRPLARPPPFPTVEDANSRPSESWPELGKEAGKGSPSPDRCHPSQGEQARWSEIMGESALEPGPVPEAPAGGPVHAVTVVTLLEKLATMLEALRERQGGLAERQGGLAGSVRRIQSGLGALSRSHDTTSNTLAQLLAKAERVGSHADAAQERAVRRAAQVQRLEANHGLLVARGKLQVLLFKVSDLRHALSPQPPRLGYHRGGGGGGRLPPPTGPHLHIPDPTCCPQLWKTLRAAPTFQHRGLVPLSLPAWPTHARPTLT